MRDLLLHSLTHDAQVVSGESGGEKENTEENTVDHPVFGGRHNDAEGEKEQTKLLRAISQRLEKIEGKLDDQQQDIASLHSEQPPTSPPQTVPLQPTSGRSPTKCKASDAASVLAADLELKRTATAARGNAGRNWCGLLGQVSAPRDMARLTIWLTTDIHLLRQPRLSPYVPSLYIHVHLRRSTPWCARPNAPRHQTTRSQPSGGVAARSRHRRTARSTGRSLRWTAAAAALPRLCSQTARRACHGLACCRWRDQPQSRGPTRGHRQVSLT